MYKIRLVKYLFLPGLMILAFFLINMREGENNYTIAFYNVENLFDTLDDPHCNDNKYLPQSKHQWTSLRYKNKINNLSKVIDELGDKDGPEIMGLCEIENKAVLNDLINSGKLKGKGYKIIHYDSPDKRGIDAALLYKSRVYKPLTSKSHKVVFSENKKFKTRDILVVSGVMEKDTIYFLINHWPSRIGGQEESEINRIRVAQHARNILDSLFKISANSKIIIMGDFNDEPDNKSIQQILKAKSQTDLCLKDELYNSFYKLKKEGRGTYKFKGKWNMLDQIMVSKSLLAGKNLKYKSGSENIYSPLWMYYKENKNSGPYRTYIGTKYYGGYSDHFPVYVQIY